MKDEKFNKQIKDLFGVDINESIKHKICVFCGFPAVKFKDKISEKEFNATGMCQSCQDGAFD